VVLTSLLVVLLPTCTGLAAPAERPQVPPPAPSAQGEEACAEFNSRVWAQTVFDGEPARHSDLDPDRDGVACEALPAGIAPALWTASVPENAEPVELDQVTDGDTILVWVDGKQERVRLVGIDTREASGPYQEVECYGPEASEFLKRLLGIDGQIFLEQDQEDRDQYGRLLRWVWADFGTGEVYLLNEALVRAGYAERYRNTPNRRYGDEVIAAEGFAQRHDLGLWGACDREVAWQPVAPVAVESDSANDPCDPAYPDVCIPSPPPDLECRQVPHAGFRVLSPDPHHFDGNGDGEGCEGPP
jgi:micrococcal nuclease